MSVIVQDERLIRFILEELYQKTCSCRRDFEELEDLLHPDFHLEDCYYREVVEKEDIKWKK